MGYETTEANVDALTDARYDVWCTSTALSHRVIITALWKTAVPLRLLVSLGVNLKTFKIKTMERLCL